MTLVVYREDGFLERVQTITNESKGLPLFNSIQALYETEDDIVLSYVILKETLTPSAFRKLYYVTPTGPVLLNLFEYTIDKTEITADGVDKATISGVVEGASVTLNDVYLGDVAADGLIEVKSIHVKQLIVILEKDLYITKRIIVNAS